MIKRVNCQPSDQIFFCGGGAKAKGEKRNALQFHKFKSPVAPTVL